MNEDVFPIENGDFPTSHVRFHGCKYLGEAMTLRRFAWDLVVWKSKASPKWW